MVALEVTESVARAEQPEVLVRVPPVNMGMAPGTTWDVLPEEVMAADEAIAGKVARSRGWLRQGGRAANSTRRARFGWGHLSLLCYR
jgi:hypothetical protein